MIPPISASTSATPASDKVTGRRSMIDAVTLRLSRIECPRSPCRMRPYQATICSSIGLSRPSAGAAVPPARACCSESSRIATGSPGTSQIMPNDRNDTSASTTRAPSSRLVRKCAMLATKGRRAGAERDTSPRRYLTTSSQHAPHPRDAVGREVLELRRRHLEQAVIAGLHRHGVVVHMRLEGEEQARALPSSISAFSFL